MRAQCKTERCLNGGTGDFATYSRALILIANRHYVWLGAAGVQLQARDRDSGIRQNLNSPNAQADTSP